uniref:Uncharacterized protein n=1 Tax=Nymphaea colorata TaxID=210225 RepID=A0A5K0WI69_9MAGN
MMGFYSSVRVQYQKHESAAAVALQGPVSQLTCKHI